YCTGLLSVYCQYSDFILLGHSTLPELQFPLFFIFLLIYLLTITGNSLIITCICLDAQIQIPMYFFLQNLSFLDLSCSCNIQPKMLLGIITGDGAISQIGCFIQLYFFASLTVTEFVLLTAMGYDRYLAICKPLHYPLLMNKKTCFLLVIICWVVGFLDPLAHTIAISQLPFCRTHLINHFYCDYSALLKLSCVKTTLIEIMTYLAGALVGMPAFSLTIASYVSIIAAIVKINSSQSRQKAFSTCVSHLTVVFLFYSTVLITIMQPISNYSSTHGKLVSLLYTIFVPSINPFIYTLRNQDVKRSFYKNLQHKI
uniref:Olfactory receptor n=1 Tax=Xenopus tropicalis TaxID=8364 RepID=A0A6I8S026_XENTR